MLGFYFELTYSYPPFSTFCFLIAKNNVGSWTDLNLNNPFPAGSGYHSWLDPPVCCHWITSVPSFLLYPAMSKYNPLIRLLMTIPFPCLLNCHLWLNLLFFCHWTILSPGFFEEAGTSRHFPDRLLIITALLLRILLLVTCSNLNNWIGLY